MGRARFWAAVIFLNAVVSVRFPERAPWLSYARPSLDLVCVLLVYALLGASRTAVSRALRAVGVGFFLAARVLRIADGVEQSAYLRHFNLSLDLPLVPELVRLFYATLSVPRFVLAACGVAALLLGLGLLIARALRVVELGLASARHVQPVSLGIGVLALVSPLLQRGSFEDSLLLRAHSELCFAAQLPSYRTAQQTRIAAVQRRLATLPGDLSALHGQDVYLFVIESYGQAVLDRPELSARVLPQYRRMEADFARSGFQVASRVLDSPTFGGRSWLAQATLLTAVDTQDSLQFELLREAQPRTLAQLFGDAGYRTVLVQPGTVRESSAPDLLHFEQHYFAQDLAYRGPRFGWATMPDQFVLEAVRRKELSGVRPRPLFVTYALVSSHIPWSDLPPLLESSTLTANGAEYQNLPRRHFETSWLALDRASEAYAEAVVYDLELLRRYICEHVQGDALLIILGDHQPHSALTGESSQRGIPVHVLSRNGAFTAPFRSRGYTAGMLANEALPRPGLEALLLDLVADFSNGRVGGAP